MALQNSGSLGCNFAVALAAVVVVDVGADADLEPCVIVELTYFVVDIFVCDVVVLDHIDLTEKNLKKGVQQIGYCQ